MMSFRRLLPLLSLLVPCCAEESNEQLYRRTVSAWRTRGGYGPWEAYVDELMGRWERVGGPGQDRLELVGGFEEGILAIEKATVARGEGQNAQRDRALSKLYCAYGKALLDLNASECHRLALDPHTLLIGVETVSRESDPSTYLCSENAENALRNAASLDATNSLAGELLRGLTGKESAHERKPKEFVAELFDSFADTFDEKLVQGLGYVVPKMVGDVAKELGSGYGAVLDAGCGTGLAGRYLRQLMNEDGVMVGVDASQKMLNIAEKCTVKRGCGLEGTEGSEGESERPLYDGLLAMDLEEMTLPNTLSERESSFAGYDLVVAADVLVYFGSLTRLLRTFASLSAPGAGLIFTCERATEEEAPLGYRLLPTGRFAHTRAHAEQAAGEAGYEMRYYDQIVPRKERGEDVQGHIFGFVLKDGRGDDEL